jgi:hypothetical protein
LLERFLHRTEVAFSLRIIVTVVRVFFYQDNLFTALKLHLVCAITVKLPQAISLFHYRPGLKNNMSDASAFQSTNRPTPALASNNTTDFRFRKRISDVDYFNGIKSEWRGWKMQMFIKLQIDSEIIGNEFNRINYVYSRLKD